MKFGDVLYTDTFGFEVKVGDIVISPEWWSNSYYLCPMIAIGILPSGNLRTVVPTSRLQTDTEPAVLYACWSPKGKSMLVPLGAEFKVDNPFMHKYMIEHSKEAFDKLMSLASVNQKKTWGITYD